MILQSETRICRMSQTSTESESGNKSLPGGHLVNDVHSRLNPTVVKHITRAKSQAEIIELIQSTQLTGEHICIAGGRHAMGGQQFLTAGQLLDTRDFNKVLDFDTQRGLITVESGILWTDLISYLQTNQVGKDHQWTIAQKQTGGDNLSIGGSLSANGHGRGLKMPPLVADVESFEIILHDERVLKCSREENNELFSLVIGGYGVFGVMSSATLRLIPRQKLQRTVEFIGVDDAIEKLEAYKKAGATYGDFQFAIDHKSDNFLSVGILSVYTPVEEAREPSLNNKLLTLEEWRRLLYLAHTDKTAAFDKYVKHYLATSGQLYWSDTFQLTTYLEDYHKALDEQLPGCCQGTELISELYVPRNKLADFMRGAGKLLRQAKADVIYGTVRIIEKDNETFMPWAKQSYACIVINLHIEHTPHKIAWASRTFCDLISLAISFGGSYFLTYHRFASREQLLTCYPEMPEFIKHKMTYDPKGLFWSDWFDHYYKLVMESE